MSDSSTVVDQAAPAAEVPSPAQMPARVAAAPSEVALTPVPAVSAPPPPSPPPPPAPAPPAPPVDYDDDDDDFDDELPRNLNQARKLRKENRNLRMRAQENEQYRDQYEQAQAALNRYQAASKYGISDPQSIALLGSGSPEDMERNAAHIAALVSQQAAAAPVASQPVTPPPSNRPVEGLRPGASPEPPPASDDAYPAGWTPNQLRTDR